MENIEDYLSLTVISEIKEKIHQADGNEVVFIGKTNAQRIVEQVNVLARGNQISVPLVQETAERSDVIIHNHPSNLLHPSSNDVFNAHKLAHYGVASFIVNNEITEIYVIVETFGKEGTLKLEIETIREAAGPQEA